MEDKCLLASHQTNYIQNAPIRNKMYRLNIWNYRILDLAWILAFIKEFLEIIQWETFLIKEPQWLACFGD